MQTLDVINEEYRGIPMIALEKALIAAGNGHDTPPVTEPEVYGAKNQVLSSRIKEYAATTAKALRELANVIRSEANEIAKNIEDQAATIESGGENEAERMAMFTQMHREISAKIADTNK